MTSPIIFGPNGPQSLQNGGIQFPDKTLLNSNGNKNYIKTADGLDASGFIAYADAAGLLPVDGTGGSGSANLTLTASATNPLSGLSSLVLSKSGSANMQGYGFSYDMTIDPSDKGKVLSYTMNYGVSSGTYSDDNVIVYFYDVTNSVLIEPIPYKIKNHTLTSDRFFSEIQVPYNCSTLRFIIHVASTTTNNFDLKIDDLVFGPQSKQYGVVVTDWKNFTPTGSWTTNTTYTGKWKQAGDHAIYKVQIALSGAPTAATLTVNLPSGHTIDTSKLPASSPNSENTTLGFGGATDSGVRKYGVSVAYNNTTSVAPQNTEPGTGGNAINATTPFTYGAGDSIDIEFSVPIVGWSSSQLSSESATRPVYAKMYMTGNQSLTAGAETVLQYNSVSSDNTGSWDAVNYRYVIKTPGSYLVSSFAALASGSGTQTIFYYRVNGGTSFTMGTTNTGGGSGVSLIPDLKAGDYVEFRILVSGTSPVLQGNQYWTHSTIQLLQGPSQIAADSTIEAQYSTSAGNSISTATIVDFGTRESDSTGSLVTTGASWKFTAPISGKYLINFQSMFANAAYTAGNSAYFVIYKNGTAYKRIAANGVTTTGSWYLPCIGSTTIRLLAGEYFDVRGTNERGATSLFADSTINTISITRVGNY